MTFCLLYYYGEWGTCSRTHVEDRENSLELLSPSKTQGWNSSLRPWQKKSLYTLPSHFSWPFFPLDLIPLYELSQYWKWYAQPRGMYFKPLHWPKDSVKMLHLQQIQLSSYQTCLTGFLLPLDWNPMCSEWKRRASLNFRCWGPTSSSLCPPFPIQLLTPATWQFLTHISILVLFFIFCSCFCWHFFLARSL